jgi:hypothetical protein
MSFARMVPEGEFDPVGYESPSGPFVPAEVADLKATVDAGIAAYERARVARDLGIGVVPDE